MRPLMLSLMSSPKTPLLKTSLAPLAVLALPLALAACGDGTDPGTTGAVDADPPAVVEPADPVVIDPAAPPAADDTTLQ